MNKYFPIHYLIHILIANNAFATLFLKIVKITGFLFYFFMNIKIDRKQPKLASFNLQVGVFQLVKIISNY